MKAVATAEIVQLFTSTHEVPATIRRQMREGESIYFSSTACYRSAKNPEGKWVAQVRRTERGRLAKYPVKAFATAQEALVYIKNLRTASRDKP